MVSEDALQAALTDWLPRQRWYQGKGRSGRFSQQRLATLGTDPVEVAIYVVSAHYDAPVPSAQTTIADVPPVSVLERAPDEFAGDPTGTEIYQVPLAFYRSAAEHLEHALVGAIEDDGGPVWIYDALQDKDVTGLWLTGIEYERQLESLRFERFTTDELPLAQPSLVLTAEQSNTSLVFGDVAILKVFRRLEPGINPDIEVHRALTQLGARHVAPLFGSLTGTVDGVATSLAMLQSFMRTASDGWDLAKISVRDLMAEGDLHASEAGGDFAGEAERLGVAVAEVHADLAEAFGTATISGAAIRELAQAMHARLDAALDVVPQLAEVADGLHATFDAFAAVADSEAGLATQRIHADLHLGQALRTSNRWIVLDFEGEPSATLAQRRAFDSPLRDLAGMLRSFDYAARYQLVDAAQAAQLEYRAIEWAERNRGAFCDGYAEASGHDPREHEALLRGYEADKAVYEAVYETRNRPSWLVVPLSSLARLIAA